MPTIKSDKELVELLSYGDESAFCLLYSRYWERLKGFCYRFVKSGDLAENYAQDVFMKIWETRTMLDPEKSFSSYIFTIARNNVINYLVHISRSENASSKFIKNCMSLQQKESGSELIEDDYFMLLQHAIETLTPRQQEVFKLSRNENLTHKQIAEQLGISVYTVQEYISDSLKSIKKYICKYTDIVFVLNLIISTLFGHGQQ